MRHGFIDKDMTRCGSHHFQNTFIADAFFPQTVDQSVKLVRRGGVVSLVGMATVPAEISPGDWLIKEVRLVASLPQHEVCGVRAVEPQRFRRARQPHQLLPLRDRDHRRYLSQGKPAAV